jgi:hypothetical protein
MCIVASLRGNIYLLVASISLLLWAITGTHAESAYDPIVAHLEFLGYQSDTVDQGIRARHRTKIHLIVSYSKGGILLQTGFPGKGSANDEVKRFSALNTFNSRAQVARAFWTPDGHLFVTAWAPGLYDKLRFAQLLEAWEKDIELLREVAVELKSYLQG